MLAEGRVLRFALATIGALCLVASTQAGDVTNRVYAMGDLIIAELAPGSYLPAHLLDLEGTTLTFTPDDNGAYRVVSGPLQWDPEFGPTVGELGQAFYSGAQIELGNFQFPFDGQQWSHLYVNPSGTISFAQGQEDLEFDRFLEFSTYATELRARAPLIAPLFKGVDEWVDENNVLHTAHARVGSDHALLTWDVTENYGGPFSFSDEPVVNLYQARLGADGSIRFSYLELGSRDAIVGVFQSTPADCGPVSTLATIDNEPDPNVPGYLDIRQIRIQSVGTCRLRVRFTLREDVPAPGNPSLQSLEYRALFDIEEPVADLEGLQVGAIVGLNDQLEFDTFNSALAGSLAISGNTVTFDVALAEFGAAPRTAAFIDAVEWDRRPDPWFDNLVTPVIAIPEAPTEALDLSEQTVPGPALFRQFEAFHFIVPPERNLVFCDVVAKLGDRFDFYAPFTDFRIDTQESAAVSTGPIGDTVTGYGGGDWHRNPMDWCSNELEVSVDYMAIGPPISQESGGTWFRWTNYTWMVALLYHEIQHRWMAYGNALKDGAVVPISSGVHWSHFVSLPSSSDDIFLGRDHLWADNGDGTFTTTPEPAEVRIGPAAYLDLYLMGLIGPEQVPDFFFIDDAEWIRNDMVRGTRIDLSIENFIALNGPRLPPVEESQTDFTLAMVGLVLPGEKPSEMMKNNLSDIMDALEKAWHDPITNGLSTLRTIGCDREAAPANLVSGLRSLIGGHKLRVLDCQSR